MLKTLTLRKPILYKNQEVFELTYDVDEITVAGFCAADARKTRQAGPDEKMNISPTSEIDYTFHVYLGFAAIMAVNPQYDVKDLEKIKGEDIKRVMQIGRSFFIRSEDSEPELSGQTSDTTQKPTEPQSTD